MLLTLATTTTRRLRSTRRGLGGGVEEILQYEEGYFRIVRRAIPLDERLARARRHRRAARGSPPPGSPPPQCSSARRHPRAALLAAAAAGQRGCPGEGEDRNGAAAAAAATARPSPGAGRSERARQAQSIGEGMVVTHKNTFIEVTCEPASAAGVRSQSSPPVLVSSRCDQLGGEPCGAQPEAPTTEACEPPAENELGTQTVDTAPPGAATGLVPAPDRQHNDQKTFDLAEEAPTTEPLEAPTTEPLEPLAENELGTQTVDTAPPGAVSGPVLAPGRRHDGQKTVDKIQDTVQPGTQTVDMAPPGAAAEPVPAPGRRHDGQKTLDQMRGTVQPGRVPRGDPELDCRREYRLDLTIEAATVNEGIGPELLADAAEPVDQEGNAAEVYLLAAFEGEPLACKDDDVKPEDERLVLARPVEDRQAHSDFLDASFFLASATKLQAKSSCVDRVCPVTTQCFVQ